MSEDTSYIVRDAGGAIYGPGTIATLRQWIAEGRITPEMQMAPQGTQAFIPVSQMPALANAFPVASVSSPAQTASQQTYTNPYGQQGQYSTYAGKSTNGLAVASLICSLCGFLVCGIPAILGIIFGHLARGQIRREPDRYEGAGLATAGLIIGYCFLGLYVMAVVIVILVAIISPSSFS